MSECHTATPQPHEAQEDDCEIQELQLRTINVEKKTGKVLKLRKNRLHTVFFLYETLLQKHCAVLFCYDSFIPPPSVHIPPHIIFFAIVEQSGGSRSSRFGPKRGIK